MILSEPWVLTELFLFSEFTHPVSISPFQIVPDFKTITFFDVENILFLDFIYSES
jgi:hypothetical protein